MKEKIYIKKLSADQQYFLDRNPFFAKISCYDIKTKQEYITKMSANEKMLNLSGIINNIEKNNKCMTKKENWEKFLNQIVCYNWTGVFLKRS